MMRNNMSMSKDKGKTMFDLHMLLKKGRTASTKAIGSYYYALTCRAGDDDKNAPFYTPREYEFSCSNSPIYPSYSHQRRHSPLSDNYPAATVEKVPTLSPSPSPFPMMNDVDRDAEEFIKMFYMDLKKQNLIFGLMGGSPSPYHTR